MKTDQIKKVIRELFNVNIEIYLQTVPGKWYESKYELFNGKIQTNTIYGIMVDGNTSIDYDFKSGKKEDNILKTFVTQYINKYECHQLVIKDGAFQKQNKKEVIAKLKNSDRVCKSFFYTTLYGIGYLCLFMSLNSMKTLNKGLSEYLKSKKIGYSNEFSDAGWVYRFVINQDVKIHNQLLTDFNI